MNFRRAAKIHNKLKARWALKQGQTYLSYSCRIQKKPFLVRLGLAQFVSVRVVSIIFRFPPKKKKKRGSLFPPRCRGQLIIFRLELSKSPTSTWGWACLWCWSCVYWQGWKWLLSGILFGVFSLHDFYLWKISFLAYLWCCMACLWALLVNLLLAYLVMLGYCPRSLISYEMIWKNYNRI